MERIRKVKQRCPLISVVVRCRDDICASLTSFWCDESFSIEGFAQEGKMIAGVIHSIPPAPMVNWNDETQKNLTRYLEETKAFVQKIMTRSQRPSVCVVISSSAVYGSLESGIEEGNVVDSNVWAEWITQYENIFLSLEQVGIRLVYVRCGFILFPQDTPSQYLYEGKEEDWISWVSEIDFCRFVDLCLRKDQVKGMYHLANSNWVQKRDFIERKRKRFSFIRKFVQQESIFSPSQKIVSRKAKDIGFSFVEDRIVKIKKQR